MPSVYSIWLFVALVTAVPAAAQRPGLPLPEWQQGQLDIHHISTGQGNATFFILPDGTTLLIDAGAIDPVDWRTGKPRNIPVKPSGERQAGEWVARYVRHILQFRSDPKIDYAIITHFHDDHMGSPLHAGKRAKGGYVLTGITEVAEYLPIRKLLDRGWPDYSYPRTLANDSMVANYRQFLNWQIRQKGLIVERFKAGLNDQITLVNQASANQKYSFEIRNLAVNGEIWTGSASDSRFLFPDLSTLPAAAYPTENLCSIAFKLRYGNFDYFSGGDIPGVLQFGTPAWHDIETPLSKVTGPVDVQLLNHHGYPDSQNDVFLASLRPRVFIIPAWASSHPGRYVLDRIYAEGYKGGRDVFTTTLLESAKIAIGDWWLRLKNQSGHVVIRVEKGGKSYRIFVIDDTNESFTVKGIYGPYLSR